MGEMSMTGIKRQSLAGVWLRRGVAVLLLLIGVFLAIGGTYLLTLGGSLYYLVSGLAVAASALLIWRGDRRGRWLFGAMLAGTLAWSIWEVGFTGWSLVPRLLGPVALGLLLLLPAFCGIDHPKISARLRGGGVKILAVSLVAAIVIGAGLHALRTVPVDPLFQAGTQAIFPDRIVSASQVAPGDWEHWGNDQGGSRFSPLDQLTPDNVKGLKVAWTADMGPASNDKLASLEVTPLKIGDTLYACTPYNTVVALDVETGKRRWTHSEAISGKPISTFCRGVAFYRVPNASGECAERIIWASLNADLVALDAKTGKPCSRFGNKGHTSLKTGMGEVPDGYYYISSAPQIIRGKIVVGGGVLDGQYWGEPSGVIRGYDAVSGKFAWAFDVARPNDHAEPTGDAHYTFSTPNSWAPISADEKLGLVYLPIGNAVPDYYGAQRRPFDEFLTASVIAIDANTGGLRWRFQTVHHDLWDYDVASQPTLIDLPVGGAVVPALIQPTKRGEVFMLDRRTGRPLRSVKELPAPQGPIAPGERLSPTQPFSVGMPSFRGPNLTEADMWGVTPLDQMLCRIKFKQARYDGPMTPPQLDRPTLAYPGFLGGSDWGSVSVDRDRMIMIVNSNRMPNYDQLFTRAKAKKLGWGVVGKDPHADPSRGQAMEGTPFAVNVQPFLSVLGTPCNAPPWGLLTAVDLRTGRVIWNRPIGTARDSGPLGIPMMLPVTIGLPNVGGSIITRGGLVFMAGVQERTFRAFNIRTGNEVWSARLPAGGQSTPMTYWSDRSKRQFVVVAAGGHVPLGTKLGKSLIAYALPGGH